MTEYVYLFGAVLCVSSSGVVGGYYTRRTEGKASALYGCIELCSVFALWCVLFAIQPAFEWSVLPYSLAFAAFFAMGKIGCIYALKSGSVAVTSLIVKSSLLVVGVWGILFWGEPFTWRAAVGLPLVFESLWLCISKGKKSGEGERGSWKWLAWCVVSLVGNAGCTIVQRMQQTQYGGEYGNGFMACATLFSAIVGIVLFVRSDKQEALRVWKRNAALPVLSGACNVVLNVCVMALATSALSATLIYPTIAVGGLLVTDCVSATVFREKWTGRQWLGLALGVLAVALLS